MWVLLQLKCGFDPSGGQGGGDAGTFMLVGPRTYQADACAQLFC